MRKPFSWVKHGLRGPLTRARYFRPCLCWKKGEGETPLHPLAQPLIHEFKDFFPDDLPPALPPVRDIEHHNDLLPGATLLNKPAYRCKPTETKKLQRQVQELIDRGYIRQSMSPCPVPALVVAKQDGIMRMCVDSRTINNIIFLNLMICLMIYMVLRCFPELIWEMAHTRSGWEMEMSGKQPLKPSKICMNGLSCHLVCQMHQVPSWG